MMKNKRFYFPFEGAACLLVIACLSIQSCQTRSFPAPIEERDLAAEVREQAASQSGVVEVYPLTDPAAAELIRQARLAEAQDRLYEALELVDQALNVTPEDPDQWQYLAELQLKLQSYQDSITSARKSYELGPKVGQLCYRNWLVISRAQAELGQPAEAMESEKQADACTVPEQPRF